MLCWPADPEKSRKNNLPISWIIQHVLSKSPGFIQKWIKLWSLFLMICRATFQKMKSCILMLHNYTTAANQPRSKGCLKDRVTHIIPPQKWEGLGRWSFPPFSYVKHRGIGLDLQHQICLESCPADSSSQIFCRGTGSTQMSYPTHPLAGMICMPSTTEFSSDLESFGGFFAGGFIVEWFSEKQTTCFEKNMCNTTNSWGKSQDMFFWKKLRPGLNWPNF